MTLRMLEEGEPPTACQECNRAFVDLESDAAGNVQMALHEKDGVYQILCLHCSGMYEQRRRDLYAGTQYGRRKGIF